MKQWSLLKDGQHVAEKYRVPFARQFSDILGLRRRGALLGATDYYQFGLYDRDMVSPRERQNFLGWRYETALSQALNPRHVVLPAWDKLACHQLLHGDDAIAMPEMIALYRPNGAAQRDLCANVLPDTDQLAHFLAANTQWPLYAKPAYAQKGVGGLLFTGFDASTANLQVANGEPLPLSVFIRDIVLKKRPFYEPAAGYLLQRVLAVHSSIAQCTGSAAISGLRLVVLNFEEGPHVERVIWKMVRGGNTNDNFNRGTVGNLVAAVDPENGIVDYALDASWPYATRLAQHPDTGEKLAGFALPCWAETLQLAKRVARHFPLVRILHMDIALTPDGPVFLEFNDLGGTLILQLHGRGILSEAVREALSRYANDREHVWVAQLDRRTDQFAPA